MYKSWAQPDWSLKISQLENTLEILVLSLLLKDIWLKQRDCKNMLVDNMEIQLWLKCVDTLELKGNSRYDRCCTCFVRSFLSGGGCQFSLFHNFLFLVKSMPHEVWSQRSVRSPFIRQLFHFGYAWRFLHGKRYLTTWIWHKTWQQITKLIYQSTINISSAVPIPSLWSLWKTNHSTHSHRWGTGTQWSLFMIALLTAWCGAFDQRASFVIAPGSWELILIIRATISYVWLIPWDYTEISFHFWRLNLRQAAHLCGPGQTCWTYLPSISLQEKRYENKKKEKHSVVT